MMQRIPDKGTCEQYLSILQDQIPRLCRQLAAPPRCDSACSAPAETPKQSPDPASVPRPEQKPDNAAPPPELPVNYRLGRDCRVGWTQQQRSAYRAGGPAPPLDSQATGQSRGRQSV